MLAGIADGLDFCVTQGSFFGFAAVATPTHNFTLADNDTAYRHFPLSCRLPGKT
jgi:hypothetical protein